MSKFAGHDAWLRRPRPAPSNAPTIILFPPAGGAATYFHGLSELLAPALDVVSVQYPGRQDRWDERPIDDIRTLAERVTEAVRARASGPVGLFGHSMGAIVAFEVAVRLERYDGVSGLMVSAHRGPTRPRPDIYPLQGDDELIDEIRLLGGMDTQLLADSDVAELIMPALRADFHAVGHYEYRPGDTVSCPITGLVGDRDPRVSECDVAAWAEVTSAGSEFRTFGGGHFYLQAHQPSLAAMIRTRLAPSR